MSNYHLLGNRERLQVFADMACFVMETPYLFIDASDPENRKHAQKWWENELNFLGKRDRSDLKELWDFAIEDGRNLKVFLNAIKYLQDKYDK